MFIPSFVFTQPPFTQERQHITSALPHITALSLHEESVGKNVELLDMTTFVPAQLLVLQLVQTLLLDNLTKCPPHPKKQRERERGRNLAHTSLTLPQLSSPFRSLPPPHLFPLALQTTGRACPFYVRSIPQSAPTFLPTHSTPIQMSTSLRSCWMCRPSASSMNPRTLLTTSCSTSSPEEHTRTTLVSTSGARRAGLSTWKEPNTLFTPPGASFSPARRGDLPELSPPQQKKLRMLTLITCAGSERVSPEMRGDVASQRADAGFIQPHASCLSVPPKILSYESLMGMLEIETVRELEVRG